MNLKNSEKHRRAAGSKYLGVSSSAPYCNSRYPTRMMVLDANTQQVLIDQLFSVPKYVMLVRMSERSYDLLMKIIRTILRRSEGKLQDAVAENFVKLSELNVIEFQKKKAIGALPTEFPTIDEDDGMHQIMTEVEPLLEASGNLEKHSDDPEAVSLPQPGADLLVFQRGRFVLDGTARPNPACIDLGS